jgi:uncharacterized protein YqjF (DUF2071 family)
MVHRRWTDALFLHFPVDSRKLQRLLPPSLCVDEFDGTAYVGIVALTEEGIIPHLPWVPLSLVRWMGLSHHAVNVRTYVRPRSGGPPGIYFFSLDCSALLPTIGARVLFNLPYRLASMQRRYLGGKDASGSMSLESSSSSSQATFSATWSPADDPADEDALGSFFVERYALYHEGGCSAIGIVGRALSRASTWSGTITHERWPLRRAFLTTWHSTVLAAVGLDQIVSGEPVAHCSSGVGPIEFFLQDLERADVEGCEVQAGTSGGGAEASRVKVA